MPRYWVIAPVESKPPELFDKVWEFDLANNLLSIGWKQLGDVFTMSRQQLSEMIAKSYLDKPQQTKGLFVNMIWAFYHEISPGDQIIARRGRKTLAAVGSVTGSPFYSPGKNPVHAHPNFIGVSWQEQPRNKLFPDVVFPMPTLAEISEEQFRKFVDGLGPQHLPTEAPQAIEDTNEFVLEKYLEDFIVSNFDTIFKGELQIYEDVEGNDGQQYTTDVGPIDILAVERKSGSFVVIELKRAPVGSGCWPDSSIHGMGQEEPCAEGQAVKGLVICRHFDVKLSYGREK